MKLPKKYRGHGLHLWCHTHKKAVTANPCSHKLVFQSRIWVPKDKQTGKSFIIKNWQTQSPDEAFELHMNFKKELIANNFGYEPKTKKSKPSALKSCFEMWLDFLQDIDVPETKKKNRSRNYILARKRHIKLFLTVCKKHVVYEVDEDDIENFAKVIPGGNRNYNDHMNTMKFFFRYLIKQGYEIQNIFEGVTVQEEITNPEALTDQDIKALFQVINYENGWAMTSQGKRINRCYPYLKEAIWFGLLTGCRVQEIFDMEWSNIKGKKLVYKNSKISNKLKRKNRTDIAKWVTTHMTADLSEFLASIEQSTTSDYIIAPERLNRRTVQGEVSHAFTHFWRLTGIDKKVTLYNTRHTYQTRIEKIQTGLLKYMGIHASEAMRIKHYVDGSQVTERLSEERLYKKIV